MLGVGGGGERGINKFFQYCNKKPNYYEIKNILPNMK
jgi:hypothetical protein